ncbi:hypothetical protein BDV95DRAFT_19562 [Massariosphaeria phaeospora]|uniref:Uncharacterized protein n=1 Tax=Massariosphaeria phaeospora TaxID=100035 RepID=A0A7C8IRM0_9PLEO|nr:hypothetical protein BDV95DRAFT_19562 [Massariosphaeria phaeospora]
MCVLATTLKCLSRCPALCAIGRLSLSLLLHASSRSPTAVGAALLRSAPCTQPSPLPSPRIPTNSPPRTGFQTPVCQSGGFVSESPFFRTGTYLGTCQQVN